MAQIQLDNHQLRDFALIRDSSEKVLRSAAAKIADTKSPLKPADLYSVVKASFDQNDAVAEAVMRQCLSLNGLMRQIDIDVDAVIAGIRYGIERDANWSTDEVKRWQTVEATFRELLNLQAFRIVAKCIDLSYEYANLYRRGRILTDIRPFFTHDADAIEGAVVSYTLRLRYESVDGEHELSIAMDEADVRAFAQQCERALKKAHTARSLMANKAGIATIVTGASDDE